MGEMSGGEEGKLIVFLTLMKIEVGEQDEIGLAHELGEWRYGSSCSASASSFDGRWVTTTAACLFGHMDNTGRTIVSTASRIHR